MCIDEAPEDPEGCSCAGTRSHITALICTATTKLLLLALMIKPWMWPGVVGWGEQTIPNTANASKQ